MVALRATRSTIPVARILDLVETRDRALWIIGRGQEILRLDLTDRWKTYQGLYYQAEGLDDLRWFVGQDGRAVAHDPSRTSWTQYGPEDGLMDHCRRIVVTGDGIVIASGTYKEHDAVCWFDGHRWHLQQLPDRPQSSGYAPMHAASDGSVWIHDWSEKVYRLDPKKLKSGGGNPWDIYDPEPLAFHSIGETPDGTMWFGGNRGVTRLVGSSFERVVEPEVLIGSAIDVMHSAPSGDLWLGSRLYGAFNYRSGNWTHHGVRNGLADNRVHGIVELADGSVLVSTSEGVSRFDGRQWATHVLPANLIGSFWGFHTSSDGSIWLTLGLAEPESTVRYRPDTVPPETIITLALDEVSQPGNTTLRWLATDPWQVTPPDQLQFSFRLNDGEWSPYSALQNHVFQALDSGEYQFEVKARDLDFNVDPTPAAMTFTVLPPVWQQPWFIALIVVFVSVTGYQAIRIISSNRRLRESNLALSEANEEIQLQTERKSAFLASMSHELRTPMNAIKGFTNMVLRRAGDVLPDLQKENLQKVDQASDHLLAMINDLLDLSKIEAGRMDVSPETFDVGELIKSCCDTVSPLVKDGVELRHEISDSIGEANTDRARLQQMVINLLSNAIKFTDSGSVTVKAGTEDGQLIIAVSDTGKGIPADELPTIFDEYRQAEGSESSVQKGTGLGLSITEKFAELLGGRVEAASMVGEGSEFTITIPAEYSG